MIIKNKLYFFLTLALSLGLPGCGFIKDKTEGSKGKGAKPAPVSDKDPKEGGEDDDKDPDKQSKTKGPQPSPFSLAGGLQTFNSCAEVEEHIEARLTEEMLRQIDQQIEAIKNEGEGGMVYTDAMVSTKAAAGAPTSASNEAAGDSAAGGAESASTDTAAAPSNTTGTNNQVAGVEEADIVKNNGTHVFHVSHRHLRIMKSWPASELAIISDTKLESAPFELLLDDERKKLVVLAYPLVDAADYYKDSGGVVEASPMPVPAADSSMGFPGGSIGKIADSNTLEVSVYDIKDPAAPRRLVTHKLSGSFQDARRVGGQVRLIAQMGMGLPEGIVTWLDSSADFDYQTGVYKPRPKAVRIEILKALAAKNAALIKDTTLEQWLKQAEIATIDAAGGSSKKLDLGACNLVHAPTVATPFGMTRITSLSLDNESVSENILLSQNGMIYANDTSLYITTPYYWWDQTAQETDYTFIHKFKGNATGGLNYAGSGGVEGMPLNQFALDEYQDNLRVATTVQRYCMSNVAVGVPAMEPAIIAKSDSVSTKDASTESSQDSPGAASIMFKLALQEKPCPPPTELRFSQVTVLSEDNGQLVARGKTAPIAPGESIFAVRFAQARGFVVTFLQTDPLYTLDLSDAAAPKIVGELKVPGFSTYIHMLDDNHLLTIGQSGNDNGATAGLALTVFDVTDMAAPTQLHSKRLSTSTWSEAQYEHKAFTYFANKGLLAIPTTGYRDGVGNGPEWWTQYYSTLSLYKIDLTNGISLHGELDMTDLYQGDERDAGWWFSGSEVRRSFFADDFVYGISSLGVTAANIEDLANPVGSVAFSCDSTCYNEWWHY